MLGDSLEIISRETTRRRKLRGPGVNYSYTARKAVQIRDVKHTFRSEAEAIEWFRNATGTTGFCILITNQSHGNRREGERSFGKDALNWAERRQRRKVEAPQQSGTMAIASITIRQHPFSSPEARVLVSELDKSLAEFYPDWEQLNHPAMQKDHNPHPPDEQTAEQASLDFFGQVNAPLEDQETRGELVFCVAFDGSGANGGESEKGEGRPVGCAALRRFSTRGRALPAELDSTLRYAELKRMFVLPAYRGRGISKLLLQQIEQYAVKDLNVDVIVLETGNRQRASLRLYEGMGYQRRSMFGEYVGADPESGGDSTCLEKRLK